MTETTYFAVARHTLNLDLPARERWAHIVTQYVDKLKPLVDFLEASEKEEFGFFAPVLRTTISMCSDAFVTKEFKQELKGIADITEAACGLDYSKLLTFNIGYDFIARCTSAVVEGAGDTDYCPPTMLRNMDWEGNGLEDITIIVDVVKEGKLLYSATTWVGMIGFLTGMRYGGERQPNGDNGAYSIALNYRKIGDSLMANLAGTMASAWPAAFAIRDIMSRYETYQEATQAFALERLYAPCYLTIAGSSKGQGCIVTRNRKDEASRLVLSEQPPVEQPNGGSLRAVIQTNIDWWVNEVDREWADTDLLLLNAIVRREKAHEEILQASRFQVTAPIPPESTAESSVVASLLTDGYTALSQPPVCNEQTIYQTIMIPALGVYETRALKNPPVCMKQFATALRETDEN